MAHNKAFCTFYEQLTAPTRIRFMHSARLACDWSHSTFYYKVKHGNLSILETAEIVKLAKEYGADEKTLLSLRCVD